MKIYLPMHLGVLLASLVLSTGLQAAPLYRSLKEHSPFMPPQAAKTPDVPKKATPAVTHDRFVLKGISKIGSTYLFSVFDKVTSKSKWLEAGADLNGFVIKSYDPQEHRIDFAWNGQPGRIQLERSEQSYPLEVVALPPKGSEPENRVAARQSQTSTSGAMLAIRKRVPESLSQTNSPTGMLSASIINFAVTRARAEDNLFVGTDSSNQFAAANPIIESKTADPAPALVASSNINPLSIFPRTTVENPSGKLPDHLR